MLSSSFLVISKILDVSLVIHPPLRNASHPWCLQGLQLLLHVRLGATPLPCGSQRIAQGFVGETPAIDRLRRLNFSGKFDLQR